MKITDTLQEYCNKVFKRIPRQTPSKELLERIKIVAHRGDWNLTDRKENTLAAFKSCLNKGIWAVEMDIRWTSDNVPIVHHDASPLRVFGEDFWISEMSFANLRKQIPLIPSLQEIVELFAGKIHLMIELKNHPTPDQAKILWDVLSPLNPVHDFHFMSLDLERFHPLKNFPNKSFVSIARTNIFAVYKKSLEMELGGFTGQYFLLTSKMKNTCQKQNILVGTGFPDGDELLFRETNRQVDWVFTNHPIELAQTRQRLMQS